MSEGNLRLHLHSRLEAGYAEKEHEEKVENQKNRKRAFSKTRKDVFKNYSKGLKN